MNRRWIGIIASIALAIIGAFLLISYVQGADERALEGEETVEVLVVTEPVAKGTSAEDLEGSVTIELVPVKLQTPGSVDDLTTLEGTFTSVDLVPGEQLLRSRFVNADTLATVDDFPVPGELLEVTLSLEPERALGGALRPGEEVAIVASFNAQSFTEEVPTDSVEVSVGEDGTVTETPSTESVSVSVSAPASTSLIIHEALVTNVQVERLPVSSTDEAAEESQVSLAPTGNLLVSLALVAEDIERTVFTAEFGSVWLARSADAGPGEPTPIQTRATVYGSDDDSPDQASIR